MLFRAKAIATRCIPAMGQERVANFIAGSDAHHIIPTEFRRPLDFYRHDMGEMYSERDLEISEVSVQVYSDAAWAEFNWNFSAKLRKDGSSVSCRGLETQIYRKNHNRWCLVHVLYSARPAEKKAGAE